jgi:hypothetical protein
VFAVAGVGGVEIDAGLDDLVDAVKHLGVKDNVFDFELTDDEMARIARLDTGGTLSSTTTTPEWVTRLATRRVD